METVPSCPNDATDENCDFKSRYDSTALTVEVIEALSKRFSTDGARMIEAMETASTKTYLGESCQYCGAFFPCTAVRPGKSETSG